MLTREEMQGKWDQLKGQITERWGQLTDDDLQKAKGNGEQLVGIISQKTGAARKEVEKFLDQAAQDGETFFRQAASKASEYAATASEQLQDQYSNVRGAIRQEYDQTQDVVKVRPMQSVGLALGVGLVAGTLIGLMLRSSRS